MDRDVSEEYTAYVFRAEIEQDGSGGDASSSYSGGVPVSNLGLDIEFTEGVRAFP